MVEPSQLEEGRRLRPDDEESEDIGAVVDMTESDWKPSEHVVIDTQNLTPDQILEFKKLIDEFVGIFSKGDEDLVTSIYSHKIILSDENPTKSRPYRVPYKQLKVVEEHIDQMLRMGVIRKSKSPWASPVVMVEKSDGSLRFFVVFRKVNEKTIKDSYPMPLIEDKLNALGGCEFFSTLDMASGYWQHLMDEDSIEKTAFTTYKGLYEFLVKAFGMCNAGASFQRAMDDTLQG